MRLLGKKTFVLAVRQFLFPKVVGTLHVAVCPLEQRGHALALTNAAFGKSPDVPRDIRWTAVIQPGIPVHQLAHVGRHPTPLVSEAKHKMRKQANFGPKLLQNSFSLETSLSEPHLHADLSVRQLRRLDDVSGE